MAYEAQAFIHPAAHGCQVHRATHSGSSVRILAAGLLKNPLGQGLARRDVTQLMGAKCMINAQQQLHFTLLLLLKHS